MNVIEVKDVSKKYRIYYDKGSTLKEKILFRNRNKYEDKWVLKDINLKIKKGETVGLIGENGSGKSTLLKLLTRIIYPNKGEIIVKGKVSSLLELGAGFHPDMTGRENIYTNASIFGLTRKEIDDRIDDIISFSELEESIDNPVRTYSSGMYMRLAFSVAINVEADILLVDEILAVGDASFQAKCFNKMQELKNKGTTIIIVSHDLGSIERLCDKSVWIDKGIIKSIGIPYDVDAEYLDFMGQKRNKKKEGKNQGTKASNNNDEQEEDDQKQDSNQQNKEKDDRWGNKFVEILNPRLTNEKNEVASIFKSGEKVNIRFEYIRHNKEIQSPVFGIGIFRDDGLNCYSTNTHIDKIQNISISDSGEVECVLKELNLLEGKYTLDLAVHDEDGLPYDYIRKILSFEVYSKNKDVGVFRLKHHWNIID
ncbi:ABC transporter ATP-binding protein [Orenia marismortui]|uniref:ABC-2 type transport system ATP-binding protein n=1 Tax=Orenia marismortui TaxID=46469 RepID=A0A4R8HGM4_9FIRM|nr:ABC transporter ATP-binding protein [Orenia marismortui]TDX59252.1 ABC-2 type transport system ATP-binding protein [Orenia marismortui]